MITFQTMAMAMALAAAILIFGFSVAKAGLSYQTAHSMSLVYLGTSLMVLAAGVSVAALIVLFIFAI